MRLCVSCALTTKTMSFSRHRSADPFTAERDSVLDILRGATKHATSLHMVFDVAIAHPHDPVIHAAVFEALSGECPTPSVSVHPFSYPYAF